MSRRRHLPSPTRRRRPGARSGFTLIEVMVALGVMVIIAVLTWETVAGALKMRDYLEQEDELERSAKVALNRISRELSLAYLTDQTAAVNTYRTVFIGQDNDDTDVIWFATRSHRRTYATALESDQAEITLWTEPDPEISGRVVLLHRESPRVDEEPDRGGGIHPLARNITRFDLQYLDPTTYAWRDEWDSAGAETPNRLPRAVQIVLTIMAPDPDDSDEEVERTYLRTVILETADEIDRSALAGNGSAGGGGFSGLGGMGGMR